MQNEKKKRKFIQKSAYLQQKQTQAEKQQHIVKQVIKQEKISEYFKAKQQKNEPKQLKTTVANVKVQFIRKKGYKNLMEWLNNQNHVYIGRHNHYVQGAVGSKWANPFKVNDYGRDGCIQQYRKYILKNEKMLNEVRQLKGKVLGCWCYPENCHGNVLAQIADSLK